jgi:hypothetical protein
MLGSFLKRKEERERKINKFKKYTTVTDSIHIRYMSNADISRVIPCYRETEKWKNSQKVVTAVVPVIFNVTIVLAICMSAFSSLEFLCGFYLKLDPGMMSFSGGRMQS